MKDQNPRHHKNQQKKQETNLWTYNREDEYNNLSCQGFEENVESETESAITNLEMKNQTMRQNQKLQKNQKKKKNSEKETRASSRD